MVDLNDPRYIMERMPELRAASGDSRSGIYDKIKRGLWTRPVKLGPRASAWPRSERLALTAAKIAGKSDDEIRALVQKLHDERKSLA